MRIIHCADIHVDSKMESHFSKEQADDRRKEIVDTFSSMVQFAKKNDVKVIIIAGDLFDTKTSQQKSIKKRIHACNPSDLTDYKEQRVECFITYIWKIEKYSNS